MKKQLLLLLLSFLAFLVYEWRTVAVATFDIRMLVFQVPLLLKGIRILSIAPNVKLPIDARVSFSFLNMKILI